MARCIDGNEAACHVAYGMSDVAFIFPITPSSPMAELADTWATAKKKGAYGQVLALTQMQGEGGAAAALHGAAQGGALVTTFTSSQGLLLMIPNLYKLAGELLPAVLHVSARQVSTVSHSIFCDHTDVMAIRQTGVAMLGSSCVQDVMDLATVAHLASLEASMPFVHFFDGFQTSHEVHKIEMISYATMRELVSNDAIRKHHARSTNATHPTLRGTLTGRDLYMQEYEALNKWRDACPDIVEKVMARVSAVTKRPLSLFSYHGAANAERLVVVMGSGGKAVCEAADALYKKGELVGVIEVHLFRPWSAKHFIRALPIGVRAIAVLERAKETGAGEPLYLDVCSTMHACGRHTKVIGGRYGLGDKMFTPTMAQAVFENLKLEFPKISFSVGIQDDVTFCSLPLGDELDTIPAGTTQCLLWGFGSDGTVGASTQAIKLIGENTPLYAQGRFFFSAHKAGGVTWSHLRFGHVPITASYPVLVADYVGCHHPSYIARYPVLRTLKTGGTFVLNCSWPRSELEKRLPEAFRKELAEKKAKFYVIDANKISKECGLGGFINVVMSTVFFKLAQVLTRRPAMQVLPVEQSIKLLKDSAVKAYAKKGEKVIAMNHNAIDHSLAGLVAVPVPAQWGALAAAPLAVPEGLPDFVAHIKMPSDQLRGNSLPVSRFTSMPGLTPPATSKYGKRGIATEVPKWLPDSCIHCNTCAIVCPHACIRPYLVTDEEAKKAPIELQTIPAKGMPKDAPSLGYRLQVSPLDCMGCVQCVNACLAKTKALKMVPLAEMEAEAQLFDYCETLPNRAEIFSRTSVKGSQFLQPLFEFPVSCQGCGESAYIKLASQLFGSSMNVMMPAASGCASASCVFLGQNPWTVDKQGHGPALGSGLFEDTAERCLGLHTAHATRRKNLADEVSAVLENSVDVVSYELKTALKAWIDNFNDRDKSIATTARVTALLEAEKANHPALQNMFDLRDELPKFSSWMIGGDGWALDIDFGGLDHVLLQGKDINVLVVDTEGYSNTGGQKSKGTPTGAVQKFAAGGYPNTKKDICAIAMGYGNIYVAQVCLNANPRQTLQALTEAEAYPGTSLVVGYAVCREQGIIPKDWVAQSKLVVDTGYWPLFRFDPRRRTEGKNPLVLDSAKTKPLQQLLDSENRFVRLKRERPEDAAMLHQRLAAHVDEHFADLAKRASETP